jgi:hypothetical protein
MDVAHGENAKSALVIAVVIGSVKVVISARA